MRLFKSNYLILTRIMLTVFILFILVLFINNSLGLFLPNTILVNTTEKNEYPTGILIDTGSSFDEDVLKSGEPSYNILDNLESLRISLGHLRLSAEVFGLKSYDLNGEQLTTLWSADLRRFNYDFKNVDSFILYKPDPKADYMVIVDDRIWPANFEKGLVIANNPGCGPGNLQELAILKTDKGVYEIDNISDLPPLEIESIGVLAKDTKSLGIESITMKRYFGRFDFYLPFTYKAWEGEEILDDFLVEGKNEHRKIDEGIIHLSPYQWLEFKGNLEKTYAEIDDSINIIRNTLYILAFSISIVFFATTGYFCANMQRIKAYFNKKNSEKSLNHLLAALFVFSLTMLTIMPVYLLKLPFLLIALASGSYLIYLNRDILKQEHQPLFGNIKTTFAKGLLIIAILLGSLILTYKLGEHDLREDEFQVVDAAAGYYYTGDYFPWNWLEGEPGENYLGASYYDRAFPHTFLIAHSYKLFGISEWSSRLVSVIFGLLYLPVLFYISRYFTEDQYLGLLAVYVTIFNNDSFVFLYRYTRMYALLIPLFLVIIYFIYRGLTDKSLNSEPAVKTLNQIYNRLNFNYFYLTVALLILYLTSLIHINSLVIIPAALVFVFVMLYYTREIKYLNLALFGIVGTLFVALAYYTGMTRQFLGHLDFFARRNYDYLEYLTDYPFPWEIGSVLFVLGLFAVFYLKGNLKYKLSYLYTIVLFSLFFFIFIADRAAFYMYVAHITPLAMILIFFVSLMFLRVLNSRMISIIFVCLLLAFVGVNYYNNLDRHYGDDHRYGSYSVAYKTIIENFSPENEVIFGQYIRDYYLQDLQSKRVDTVNMLNHKKYSFEAFIEDLNKQEAGWIIWETRKSYHLKDEITEFIGMYFEKYHGRDIDDSKIEVYYFKQPDLFDSKRYLLYE